MPINDQIVTPAIAAEWLKLNTANRPMSAKIVDNYSKEMTSGNRLGSGADAVVFAINGTLLNGQHRLAAIVKSGISIEVAVRTGADPQSFVGMDQGKRRLAADHSALNGIRHRSTVASALRFLAAHDSGAFKTCGSSEPDLPPRDVVACFERYPEMESNAVMCRHYKLLRTGAAIGAFTLCARLDRKEALDFFCSVGSGEGLVSGSAEIILRRQLESDSVKIRRESPVMRAARLIKGFNLYRENKATGRNGKAIQVYADDHFPSPK